jgi:uncharacterized protein YjbJ (UPF0337 family)
MWNKNERQGHADQAKGKVKQAVGTLTGDESLKADGRVDEAAGKVQATIGRTSRKAGEVVARAAKAVKR